jgi:AraC-like DNA-binding protein
VGYQGAYGQRLGDVFQLDRAPALVTRSLQKSKIAVTEIKCDIVNNGLTAPIPREEAFLVTLQLRDCPRHDLFIDGKQVPTSFLRAGAVSVYDLRSNPIANSTSPFHSLHFYIPRSALDVIADMEGCCRVDELRNEAGLGTEDAILRGLGAALLPAFRHPKEADQIFVDHITVAAAAHVLKTYGIGSKLVQSVTARLAPCQERRVKEILSTRLDGEIFVSDLANECGLPIGAFLRAFRQSTGTSPHRWLMQQRIDRAKALLCQNTSLQEVALACGFASESHLVRVFQHETGLHPETWRHR